MSDEQATPAQADTVATDTEPKRKPGRPPKAEPGIADVLAGMNELSKLVLKQSETVNSLVGDVERLKNPHLPTPAEEKAPPPLPEGVTRFRSRYKEYSIGYEDTNQAIVGGVVVEQEAPIRPTTKSGEGKTVRFNDFVADVTDPRLVEYLVQHKDYGVDFFIDPTATRRVTELDVKQGPRGQVDQPAEQPALSRTY